jgi:hypothetical protein
MAAVTSYKSNRNYAPSFLNAAGYDWHPSASDATNMPGTNLTTFLSLAPGIDRDIFGYKNSTYGWIAGALTKVQDPNLILRIEFNGYATNTVEDFTPYEHHSLGSYGTATNWPVKITTSNGIPALQITKFQYMAITNWDRLTNMGYGTFMCHARYYTNATGDSVVFDAGNGGSNSWHFGRDDSFFNSGFWVYTDSGVKTQVLVFPDSSSGVDSGIRHYAVTWTNGTFVGYTNGVSFQTNTITCAFLSPFCQNHWIGVGCYTHNGTADFTDNEGASPDNGYHSYPNNGFLQGEVADIRIYSRVLSASDITAAMNDSSTGGGSNPPASDFSTIKVSLQGKQLKNGKVISR